MSTFIADRKFIVETTPQRIWDLLLRATMRLMPFEKCFIESDTEFKAVLKMQVAFVKVPMDVHMKIVDMLPPERMITNLHGAGMNGLAWVDFKSTFKITKVGENQTEVYCLIEAEKMAGLLKMFFMPMIRSFSSDAYKGLEEKLKSWA